MVRIGKKDTDYNVWGITHDDYHRTLLGASEYIEITKNGNNPPTIAAKNRFQVYKTETITPAASPATGNAVYPANTSVTYFCGEAIFEPAARTWANWAAIGATQSDGTWYLYCSGAEDSSASSIGRGNYGLSKTETPTYDELKGGWYSASGYRVLARFVSTSGTISDLMQYSGHCKERGYYEGKGLWLNGNALTLYQCGLNIGNQLIEYLENVVIKADVTTGLTASTWYAVLCNVATGAITYTTIATQISWTGHTLSSNQLNALSTYDNTLKYCYVNDATNYYRVIGVFKVNSGGNGLSHLYDIVKLPPSVAICETNSNNTVNNNTPTYIDFEDIVVDMNSEITTGAAWKFTAKQNGFYQVNSEITFASGAGWAAGERSYFQLDKNGSVLRQLNVCRMQATINPFISQLYGAAGVELYEGEYIQIKADQDSGGNLNLSTAAIGNWINIMKVNTDR